MDRSSQHPALIIHTAPFGESNLWAELLTPDLGLVRCAAYGAGSAKGTLRGKVLPFSTGTGYLYATPNSEIRKITDFDVSQHFYSIRESLQAYYHASLWAEVLKKTHGGGGGDPVAFSLALEALTMLDACVRDTDALECRVDPYLFVRVTIQWLWRYADCLGVQPELPPDLSAAVTFRPGDHGFSPLSGAAGNFEVSPRTIAYLVHTKRFSFRAASAVPLSEPTARNVLGLSLLLAEDIAQESLNTVHTGMSVFTV